MISPKTHIGAVHLTTPDVRRATLFYEAHLGFAVHHSDDHGVTLGAPGGTDLLVLHPSTPAPRVRGTTGLYHFAVLVPTRADLARALRRLVMTDTVLQGVADHGVSEALYLADPDGNGIEIYRDRPRGQWPVVNGQLRMGADPLDVERLLADADSDGEYGAPRETTVGHVHLHVSDLQAAHQFYVDLLGFELMQRYGPSALFVAAGGYHHHVGLNTWAGVGAPPPPPGAIGLRHFEVMLPDGEALAPVVERLNAARVPVQTVEGGVLVKDPASNAILLRAGQP